mmetsp:Transcript_4135/g.11658  ORF Transcript_4135/g.11658 Transcript_4135/m.11658 type:complete len:88 (+) Transcript_4135:1117-1380(+)
MVAVRPSLVTTRKHMRVFWGHELVKPSSQKVGVQLLSEAGLIFTTKMHRVGHCQMRTRWRPHPASFPTSLGHALPAVRDSMSHAPPT